MSSLAQHIDLLTRRADAERELAHLERHEFLARVLADPAAVILEAAERGKEQSQ